MPPPAARAHDRGSGKTGGSDGARTRDLRRDRPDETPQNPIRVSSSSGQIAVSKTPSVETGKQPQTEDYGPSSNGGKGRSLSSEKRLRPERNVLDPALSGREQVRQAISSVGTAKSDPSSGNRLAHPSPAFPIVLNERWRIVDDPLQWIVQRRKGTAREKNQGWQSERFHLSRDHMLEWIKEHVTDLDSKAKAALISLPERHP